MANPVTRGQICPPARMPRSCSRSEAPGLPRLGRQRGKGWGESLRSGHGLQGHPCTPDSHTRGAQR